VKEVSGRNFGLLIAYVLPGFAAVLAAGRYLPRAQALVLSFGPEAPTVGGFLHVTLASVGVGLTLSTIRWLLVDTLHHLTGVQRPPWDDSKLQERLDAFESLVDNHYRYYQYYANTLTAGLLFLLCRLVEVSGCLGALAWTDWSIVGLIAMYWAGSRDTLKRYYTRASFLLGMMQTEKLDDKRSLHGTGDGEQV
jgi:hypothetical protein